MRVKSCDFLFSTSFFLQLLEHAYPHIGPSTHSRGSLVLETSINCNFYTNSTCINYMMKCNNTYEVKVNFAVYFERH